MLAFAHVLDLLADGIEPPELVFGPLEDLGCAAGSLRPPRLMWKFSIDIAERNGALFRLRLLSAERFSEREIPAALRFLKTPRSRSSASLVRMTRADQRVWVRATTTS